MAIPKTPCPVGGLVPVGRGVWPIKARKEHPVLLWLYCLHEKDKNMGLIIHYNLSQEEIVRGIDDHCRFRINDRVQIGQTNTCRILKRKWDFERGTVIYALSTDLPGGRIHTMDQDTLLRRIKEVTEEHA